MMKWVAKESTEEKRVVDWAKRHGLLTLKLQRLTGLPDRVFLQWGGRVCFVEMKRSKGGKVSRIQAFWIDKLRDYGLTVQVCHGSAEAIAHLEAWMSGSDF